MRKMSKKLRDFLYFVAVMVLISLISFFLGRLSVLDSGGREVEIHYPDIVEALTEDDGELVVFASKNGSKYYFDWCSSQVKDSNKVYFNSEEKAQSSGYSLASGCTKY